LDDIEHLVKWMQVPNMRLVDILRKVRQGVVQETDGKQNPDYDDKLNDAFFSFPRGAKERLPGRSASCIEPKTY
jgi:hypothetical protein